ncbi:MAG: M1 family metallopeptidase [Chloroflexota bacterium]
MKLLSKLGLTIITGSLMLFVLSACLSNPAEVDPMLRFTPAMRPEFQDDLALMDTAPVYSMDVTLDQSGEVLTGTAQIEITNTSNDSWSDLVFRFYPMLNHYGGRMTLQNVSLEQDPTNFVYDAGNTAVRVDLFESLLPDERITVEMGWRIQIPTWPDSDQTYALFGRSQQMISLPLFYPSLAVYQPGPISGTGSWWLEQGIARGDSAFNVTSLFAVTTTIPADHLPVASGTLITSTLVSDDYARHVWVTGPSREFMLHTSPQFSSAHSEAQGTRVTSYWLPGDEGAGRAALNHAIAALRIYTELYGPYPYRDMRVAPAPLTFRGMEYPQVNLLGSQVYNRYRQDMETLVAHEVAHQWWYQLVHNDPVNQPWLDEALAEYSVKLYYEALRGQANANNLRSRRWQTPVDALIHREEDTMIDQPVKEFQSSRQYETVIYAKGALFYEEIYQLLGRRQFARFMQRYLEDHRYSIITSNEWAEYIRTLNNPRINQLYQQWVQNPIREPQIEVKSDE